LVKGVSGGPWSPINKVLMKILAAVLVAVVFSCVSRNSLADQAVSTLRRAERWAEIARIRLQTAREHERQGAFRVNDVNKFEIGDLLDFSGDERFLASQNYQMAIQHWEKAATAYRFAGDSDNAKIARENVDRASEAAKRTLREGIDLYMQAKEQYEATNNLDKKITALEKVARNLERLMEMK
jgi:tetratricopeptide (TPR) repeat protein